MNGTTAGTHLEIALINPILRSPNIPSTFGVEGPVVLSEADVRMVDVNLLGQALADLGHRVTVYAADAYLEGDEVALSDRLTVVGVPTYLRRIFNPALIAFTPGIGDLLRRRGADVIQSAEYYRLTTLFASRAAASMGAVFVIWQETFRHMRIPGQWFEQGLELVTGPATQSRTRCFVPRTIRARAYLERVGVPPSMIRDWIPNGVDGATFRPESGTWRPEDFGLAKGLPLAIVVARLSPDKGVDLAIRSLGVLRKQGREVGLLVRGDGPLRRYLEEVVRREGVGDLVRFVPRGSREDLAKLLNSCTLSIVPSRNDLLPYALIEAGACGLPAVAVRTGCMDDFVADGVNGIMVAPDSPEAIAGGVTRLVEDYALRDQMAAAARQRFLKDFDLRVTAKRFAQLYADLLGHEAIA